MENVTERVVGLPDGLIMFGNNGQTVFSEAQYIIWCKMTLTKEEIVYIAF